MNGASQGVVHPSIGGRLPSVTAIWIYTLVFFGAVVLIALPIGASNHFIHVMIMVFLYSAMAQSWNIMAGLSGQISLGHAAFFGIGAYSAGVIFSKFGISPWIGILVGVFISAALAGCIGGLTLGLKGHHFAIATLLIGFSLQIIFSRWDWVGAASGLFIPFNRTSPWTSFQFNQSKLPYYYLALAFGSLTTVLAWRLARSKLGMRLQAIRDNADAAASLGIAVARYKIFAFLISAVIMSIAGSFYAQYVLVLDPERVFSVDISTLVLAMAVLGGTGSLFGPVLGAAILIPLSEYTRIWLGGTGRAIDLILYGLLILSVCLWRPDGILKALADRLKRGEHQ